MAEFGADVKTVAIVGSWQRLVTYFRVVTVSMRMTRIARNKVARPIPPKIPYH
jgi:hypothetical protein